MPLIFYLHRHCVLDTSFIFDLHWIVLCFIWTFAEERNFKCQMCGKAFRQKAHLQIHMNTHMPVKHEQCGFCGERFTRAFERKQHELQHTKQHKIECQHCSKVRCRDWNFPRFFRRQIGADSRLLIFLAVSYCFSTHVFILPCYPTLSYSYQLSRKTFTHCVFCLIYDFWSFLVNLTGEVLFIHIIIYYGLEIPSKILMSKSRSR